MEEVLESPEKRFSEGKKRAVKRMQNPDWMRNALDEAHLAKQEGEVPVGAVLIDERGQIIASAHNLTETTHSALAHAELLAIAEGCRQKKSRRLFGCTLYVTLEPCPMCAGAIVGARIPKVVIAAKDPRAGAFGSLIDLNRYPLESKPEIFMGSGEEESLELLRSFFEEKRTEKERKK